jgi:hypothetical protein
VQLHVFHVFTTYRNSTCTTLNTANYLVSSISVKLRKENALRLAHLYELPEWYYEVGPTHDPTSALRILVALEGKGVFAPNNLAGLTKALETIEREDLAQIV